jgi:hypothetical protein
LAKSACDLSGIFGDLAAHVPDGPPGYPNFIFHAGVLPRPPASISTDRIIIRKGYHDYNGWYRADALRMYLTQKKCRELALFMLAVGFHCPRKATTLSITHPDSSIRRIIIRASELRLDDPPAGFSMTPFALNYYPSETETFPWTHDCNARDLPVLALSNADDCVGPNDRDWLNRDTIWMGMSEAEFRLAELMLNAGCSWNPVREYALEGDAGYRGVGPMSAELRIFLPGSDGWIYSADEVPATDLV